MAIKTQEELLNGIRGLLADDTSDESLSLLEDVSDTLNNLTANDNEDWKKKYEENDKEWRKKYRDRFFNTGSDDVKNLDMNPEQEKEDKPIKMRFEDLFETKGG